MNHIPHILFGLLGLVALFFLTKTIFWYMKYEYVYSKEITVNGKVVYRHYVPSRTETYVTTDSNGNLKTRFRTIPAKYYVKFTAVDLGTYKYNRRSLYNNVEDGQEIKVIYVKRFIREKERPMTTKVFDKNVIKAIEPKIGKRIKL